MLAEFGFAELVKPIGDGLSDGAGLFGDERLSGKDFICREAVVLVPLGEFVAHKEPLSGDEGVGFLGIDEKGEGAAPAGRFEEGFGDERAVSFAPLRIFLEGGSEFVVEDAMIDQNGFGELEGGGAEVAVEFHGDVENNQ